MKDLFDYQEDWKKAVPDAINEQRKAMQEFYDCDILVRGGDGQDTEPPLEPGDFTSIAVPACD